MLRTLLLVSLLLAGCFHSGLTRAVDVTVPEEIAATFSEDSPGLLVAELGGNVSWFHPLCGQPLAEPFLIVEDLGYGCLSEDGGHSEGDEEAVRVWIEPLPQGWEAAEVCSDTEFRELRHPRSTPEEGETVAALAAAPEEGWAQAEGTGTWKRDGTACGGVLRVGLTLR